MADPKNTLQFKTFRQTMQDLDSRLEKQKGSEKAFLATYRKTRQSAFELQFLAKFYRKTSSKQRKTFERIAVLAKSLEDNLGAFNEIDEMITYVGPFDIRLPDGTPACEYLTGKRTGAFKEVQGWLETEGWNDRRTLKEIDGLLTQIEWLDEEANVAYSREHVIKALNDLQDEIEEGCYSPKKKTGYALKEVEPKVHELRREIRKIAMYMSYTRGVFELKDKLDKITKKQEGAIEYFEPMLESDLAKNDFAQLPKPQVKKPLPVPRPLFLAVTKYVNDLGKAKDWAQNLERLMHAGLEGKIDLDQLDPALKDWQGTPVPFNTMVTGLIKEIQATQLFRVMAQVIEKSA